MVDICALCGRETEMTFEHIPPRSCFNSAPAKPVAGDVLIEAMSLGKRNPWDTSGLPYSNQQKGIGKWSLCKDCNSNTGKWYGGDYSRFVHTINHMLVSNKIDGVGHVDFEMFDVHPLRIVKQIISMICSINQEICGDARFKELARFVLQKEAKGINKHAYKIYIFIARNHLIKYCPFSILLKQDYEGGEIFTDAISEMFAYPLGAIICFDPRENFKHYGADITSLCDCSYDQRSDMYFSIPVIESYNVFPCDYRSMEEITNCMNSSAIDGVED